MALQIQLANRSAAPTTCDLPYRHRALQAADSGDRLHCDHRCLIALRRFGDSIVGAQFWEISAQLVVPLDISPKTKNPRAKPEGQQLINIPMAMVG